MMPDAGSVGVMAAIDHFQALTTDD